MNILKISINIDQDSFSKDKIVRLGRWYMVFLKYQQKPNNVWEKIALFLIHLLGKLAFLYIKFLTLILLLSYKISKEKEETDK